ncbi:CaiB/BaiF CoA-transferase family protein [Salinicola salarius]|uniref:CaiB/BaiF CoA transferase family protein n=1 Tax=Salinicola salarius TaxID=430457 RepID=UPI0023E39B77|nr:CaiB/BaiF CoA-transferase family protein [Salinicola salarius]MDF3917313.1 CaiB/BaiF CoA-transferase family protein [Salinicola salarius]
MSDVTQPLAGLKVLDLSRVLAGPWCTQQLADLGAEVVKIERPGQGDDTRAWGPPWLEDAEPESTPGTEQETKASAYFLSANRGKRSVAIDLSTAEGQELVRRLAAKADVVIENFKVGGLAAYGLDYASLKRLKPELVYCSITGFGQDGPYAGRAGYDFLIQGMGGLMSLTGEPDDRGGEPMKVGVAITDIFTGLYAANAILAALRRRDATGEGGYIDMALLDVQVGVLANQALNYLTSGQTPQRMGNAHPNIVPYQAFAASDGHLIVTVGNDTQFRHLCEALGESEWAADPRFATNAQRVAHRELLVARLSERFVARPRDEWLALLEAHGVPCGPINTLDQVFDDPQVRHREMVVERTMSDGHPARLVANPITLDGQRMTSPHSPPRLGEHTESVLSDWLALDAEALADLRRTGAIA